MLDKRQSFEIGVKAAREYRPISSNDFRFVIRGGQRFEARPRKREKSNIEFPPNPLLTRESRWYRGYLDRTNQVSDLWKPRNSTAFAFLSPISFLLLHPSTIIIVEKSISTFLSTNHRVTKISTHSRRETCSPGVLARIISGKRKRGAWKIVVESRDWNTVTNTKIHDPSSSRPLP